jgi:hypothetical protein
MSMTTTVRGFRPPDEKWKKMKAVWDSCQKAGIEVPDDVQAFFNWVDPDPRGVETDLTAGKSPAAKEWGDSDSQGYEVDLSRLPKGLTFIRFCNSW